MSEQSLESRARQAQHELAITEEARGKLRALWLEEAVRFAKLGKPDEANHFLLRCVAIDEIEIAVRTPIDDHEIEKKAAELRAEQERKQ